MDTRRPTHGCYRTATQIITYALDLYRLWFGKQPPLRHGESVGLKFRFDWNNRPAQGSDEEDLRLVLTLGYETGS